MGGCVKNVLTGISEGQPVSFSASTSYSNGAGTKTEYSGEFVSVEGLSGTTSSYERIDWVSGDKIRIYSPEATRANQHFADYQIVGQITPNGKNSSGQIAPLSDPNAPGASGTDGGGLVWSDASSHSFYALYPSPRTDGALVTMSDNTVTATIPDHQQMRPRVTLTNDAGEVVGYLYRPDMSRAYMYAAALATSGGTVELQFKPLMTAFEITLGTDADQLVINSIYLSTNDSGTQLAGTFSGNIQSDNSFALNGNPTATSKFLFADLPEFDEGGTLTLEKGKPITFTLFGLPIDHTGMALKILLADNTTREIELRYADDPTHFVTFDACRKYRITNLEAPEAVWIYTLEPTGPTVTLPDGTVAAVLSIGDDLTGSAPFTSYKTSVYDPTDKQRVPVEILGYATADADGNCNDDWSTTLPTGLTSITPAVPDLTATLAAAVSTAADETVKTRVNGIVDHARILKSRAPVVDLDLSLYDIEDLTTPRPSGHPMTANCYIVDRPGSYRFPLVYGNAIDWTRATEVNDVVPSQTGCNLRSYTDGTGEPNVYQYNNPFLHDFLRYDDNPITSPYILTDLGLTVSDVEAVVVWEDVESSTYRFIDEDPTVELVTTDKFFMPDGTQLSSMPYIKFNVPVGAISEDETVHPELRVTGIRQGNAMIALRKKSDQTILWSWHIWVTDQPMDEVRIITPTSQYNLLESPETNFLLPYYLGWNDMYIHTIYTDHVWYVKIRQAEGDTDPIVFKVLQNGEKEIHSRGNVTYYEWGRKDPFLPLQQSNIAVNKRNYSPAGFTLEDGNPIEFEGETRYKGLVNEDFSGFQAGQRIQKPYVIHTVYVSIINNAWNAVRNTRGSNGMNLGIPVYKTVYDPCPPGYAVPMQHIFFSFANGSTNAGVYNGWIHSTNIMNAQDRDGDGIITYDDFEDGWYFYTDAARTDTIFFPATGARIPRNDGFAYSWSYGISKLESPGARAFFYTSSMIEWGQAQFLANYGASGIFPARETSPSVSPVIP
ncbi:MAG: hypothetical protein Q4E27_09670 [Bacteroidales bacterium]|nr:hypothetical protein [Bacteroidales bacterium]